MQERHRRQAPAWRRAGDFVAVACLAAGLTACGGGEPESAAAADRPAPLAQQQPLRAAAAPTQITAQAFFNWAEKAYSAHFYGPSTDGVASPFEYRHYQWPGNYLGVANGTVYLLGPLTNNEVIAVAPLEVFRCHLVINSCVDSWKAATLDGINVARRASGGVDAVEVASLSAAAQSQASYSLANYYTGGTANAVLYTTQPDGTLTAHYQTPGTAGFTGTTPSARAQTAGYRSDYFVSEVSGSLYGVLPSYEPDVPRCVTRLLATVFHRAGLLNPQVENIGVGVSDQVTDANGFRLRVCVYNTGMRTTASPLPLTWSGIYPGNGQTAVAATMEGEAPDPAPSIAVKGFPISFQGRPGSTISVESFQLADDAGAVVPTVQVTNRESPLLQASEVYLIPVGALKANTRYTARFKGSAADASGRVPFDRTWSFTTG